MLINEVETKVGLSKKSIRFYESNGLLNPKRNNDNSYRIYDEEDIKNTNANISIENVELPDEETSAVNGDLNP